MNKDRTKRLCMAADLLQISLEDISRVIDEEEDALYNIPENLQYSESYEKREDVIDLLKDSVEDIESAIKSVYKSVE